MASNDIRKLLVYIVNVKHALFLYMNEKKNNIALPKFKYTLAKEPVRYTWNLFIYILVITLSQ